jgi:Caspase domain
MNTSRAHVLIIGIDQHDSPRLPALSGARNDAVAWYRLCVDHLGISPGNITVLASPRLGPRELGPRSEASRLRGATRAEILEEARRLAASASSGAGLVTFSGHGLALGPGGGGAASDLALCPSDVKMEAPAGGDAGIDGAVRFADLAEIFTSQDCRDNITVVLDTCYSNGLAGPMRGANAAPKGAATRLDELDGAQRILRVDAFTNRLFLGARHWTSAHEIKVGGQWRGAASYAMQTLIERWQLREENGVRYPNVSHADLLARMRDLLAALGVPQLPALWGQRRLDEMPVLRPTLRFFPGETSPAPDAAMIERQCPVNPDKIALISILDQNQNPILHVVSVGREVPSGVTGYNARTEYWFTNTTSIPTLTSVSWSVSYVDSQRAVDDFVAGWNLDLRCAQLIGPSSWAAWTSGVNTAGKLFRASDPTGRDTYMGLYLEHGSNGTLRTYAFYRISLLADGFAYETSSPPGTFTAMTSTDPNTMATGSWSYSQIVAPP